MSESEDLAATADTPVTAQRTAEVEDSATAATLRATTAHAPGWIRRRARNVYRRPLLVSAVGLTVFVAVLLAAVLAARAKSVDAIDASVPAMLAGAGALGLVVGFAVGLALEVRDPRVSDEDEAESIAGVRVLASIGEAPVAPVRRRRADQEMPPLVELYSDAYRLVFAQLADRADNLPLLSIVGDDALTTAVVSANLGAVAARQVRDVLVIDTDVERQSLSSVTRVRGTPGLVDVLAGRVEWAAAVRSVVVDRDRTLDVLPSGAFGAHQALDSMIADVAQLLEHVSRRYDCVLLSAPVPSAGGLSLTATLGSPVVVVRRARTPVRSLSGLTGLIRDRGCRMRGILVWTRGEPIAVSA